MITIRVDEKQLARAELLLKTIPNGISKAIVAAINRAAEGTRTDAVRKTRGRYIIRTRDASEVIRVTKATLKNQVAVIRASGTPIPLSKFRVSPSKPPAKRRKNPIVARVTRGGGGPIKGAFVARMQSGHVGVFQRVGKTRLPIVQRFGPSAPQMIGHESVVTSVMDLAQERLGERLDHEIDRLLRGVGK